MQKSAPCCVEGCKARRHVTAGGLVLSRCDRHRREYQRNYAAMKRGNVPAVIQTSPAQTEEPAPRGGFGVLGSMVLFVDGAERLVLSGEADSMTVSAALPSGAVMSFSVGKR